MRSLYSIGHLNSIESRWTWATTSNVRSHSRGLSQVAISRIISRIGETHIPWTLEGSHYRVTSITAWVICYLQRIEVDTVGSDLLVESGLVPEVGLHVLEETFHWVQLRRVLRGVEEEHAHP